MICATPIVGAVMDIVVWLRGLGLGKYEAAFRENDIDETVLTSLTGTVRNSVCEAIMMEGKGASYGYRERPAGPTFSWA